MKKLAFASLAFVLALSTAHAGVVDCEISYTTPSHQVLFEQELRLDAVGSVRTVSLPDNISVRFDRYGVDLGAGLGEDETLLHMAISQSGQLMGSARNSLRLRTPSELYVTFDANLLHVACARHQN